MAVTMFVVRATITKDKEAAFNKWYNEEHAPQVLQFNGAVSARRYRKILGEDKFQYMAVYEFASEDAFKRFQQSDHLKALVKDYDAERLEKIPPAAIRWVLQDDRVSMLNIGVSMPSDIDKNLAVVRSDTTFTNQDHDLLADFSARLYESDAVKAMRVT